MKATNILWDTDGDEAVFRSLPSEMEIPRGMTDPDEISDYLTETAGFCHFGFELDEPDDPDGPEGCRIGSPGIAAREVRCIADFTEDGDLYWTKGCIYEVAGTEDGDWLIRHNFGGVGRIYAEDFDGHFEICRDAASTERPPAGTVGTAIRIRPSCFAPLLDMTVYVPRDRDAEEYIDELLDGILSEDAKLNVEWDFL